MNSAPPGSRVGEVREVAVGVRPGRVREPDVHRHVEGHRLADRSSAQQVERPQRHALEAVVVVLDQQPAGRQRGVAHLGVVLAPSRDRLLDEHVGTGRERQLHQLAGAWPGGVRTCTASGSSFASIRSASAPAWGTPNRSATADASVSDRSQTPTTSTSSIQRSLREVGVGDPAEADKNHAHRGPPVSRVGMVRRREPRK